MKFRAGVLSLWFSLSKASCLLLLGAYQSIPKSWQKLNVPRRRYFESWCAIRFIIARMEWNNYTKVSPSLYLETVRF